jgi:hypothetical protein
VDKWTQQLILKIADRAAALALTFGVRDIRSFDVMIAVGLAHEQKPLRLQELAEADDGNFGHDVFGILKHMDTDTGELIGFSPRFTAAPR